MCVYIYLCLRVGVCEMALVCRIGCMLVSVCLFECECVLDDEDLYFKVLIYHERILPTLDPKVPQLSFSLN